MSVQAFTGHLAATHGAHLERIANESIAGAEKQPITGDYWNRIPVVNDSKTSAIHAENRNALNLVSQAYCDNMTMPVNGHTATIETFHSFRDPR